MFICSYIQHVPSIEIVNFCTIIVYMYQIISDNHIIYNIYIANLKFIIFMYNIYNEFKIQNYIQGGVSYRLSDRRVSMAIGERSAIIY